MVINLSQTISTKKFVNLFICLIFILCIVFGYFYWKKTPVLTMINDIPIVDYTNPPEYKLDIFGETSRPFSLPLGVLAKNGKVYASDSDTGIIQIFDYNGNHIRSFGFDKGPGKLLNPYGLAIYKDTLYVTDSGLRKIMMFDLNGEYKGSIQPNVKNFIISPAGITVKTDKIYITDLVRRTVSVMDLNGKVQFVFGGKGEANGQFDYPHAVVLDTENHIFVADSGNNRIQIFDQNGRFLKILGNNELQIGTPRGMAFDKKGNLYVVSGIENRVYVFNKKDEVQFQFTEEANQETMSLPNGITIDEHDQIFISETGNKKVSLFSYQ